MNNVNKNRMQGFANHINPHLIENKTKTAFGMLKLINFIVLLQIYAGFEFDASNTF